jgi:signal transduction histidine kinase
MGNGEYGLLCSLRDITPRKEAELELRRALEKSRELTELKTRFISTASHEFRTPLAVILASTELLYFYGNRMSGEQRTEHLMQIKHGVESMTTLLDNVLQVNAAADAPYVDFKPTLFQPQAVIGAAVDALRAGIAHQHELQVRYSGGHYTVYADAEQLRNSLTHLVSNAVKFSPLGSRIEVLVRSGTAYTMIRVRDFGVGIPAADVPHLFEGFYKGSNAAETPGAGLGLTIVKQSVDLHRGRIKVRSVIGRGTTVAMLLPGQSG